jgi:hypothetical protein
VRREGRVALRSFIVIEAEETAYRVRTLIEPKVTLPTVTVNRSAIRFIDGMYRLANYKFSRKRCCDADDNR